LKYDLTIRERNIVPHIDIEKDIKETGDGLFTFTLRVNNGNIVDYVNFKNIQPKDNIFGKVSVTQLVFTRSD
jgi:hypothetical protein